MLQLNFLQWKLARRELFRKFGIGIAISSFSLMGGQKAQAGNNLLGSKIAARAVKRGGQMVDHVIADPEAIPSSIERDHPTHHEVTFEAQELTAHLEQDKTFPFLTYNGQVPGPMIRVRQGDTITFTLRNPSENNLIHNVDMHAVYGTGGGSKATTARPGEQATETVRFLYPGAFIYHCAPVMLDYHVSSGAFGMVVVEPENGLPPVDREFYLGQHEVYTTKPRYESGFHEFDMDKLHAETPNFLLFNGAVGSLTEQHFGPLQAKTGETVRIFFVNGGPNLSSSFHPIGNVFARAWPEGAIANSPQKWVQTQPVAPGSCLVADLELPVPQTIKLVDHALSRVAHKDLFAEIKVEGEEKPEIFRNEGKQPIDS